jgi:hypothetical protein
MQWPLLKKVVFRFLFVYLVLYCVQVPPAWLWNRLVPRVGEFFGLIAVARFNGSGDTAYHYVQVFCFVLIAACTALVWSFADYKRPHYHRLSLGLRVLVRLSLGMTLIGYGAVKVIPTQFPPLALHRLVQPFGDASPMGLLWTFMSASAPYTIFSGVAEMLSGILLFFPRTTTLGALICIGVMSQVAALNFSYDVPVKLYSLHLLAMAIFLAAPDVQRLANVFLFNRVAEPASTDTVLQRPVWRRAAFVLKILLLGTVTATSLYNSYATRKRLVAGSPLYGIWEVEEFAQDGEVRPPLLTDKERWRRLIVGYSDQIAFIQQMDGSRLGVRLHVDPAEERLFLRGAEFTYGRPTPDTLLVEGTYQGRAIRARLHLVRQDEFRLMNRGFHWINESPFNR